MEAVRHNPLDAPGSILAALVISAIGALFYNMLPLYLGLAQDFRQLDTRATGFIGGAFFFGYNIATLSAFFWIRRVNWRLIVLFAVPVGAFALYAGSLAENYLVFLAATVVAGGAFAAMYGIGTTAVGDTSNPSRWFGVKIAAEAGVGAVLFIVLPGTLVASYGFEGMVLGMIITMAILAPFAFYLPARGSKAGHADLETPGPARSVNKLPVVAIWLTLAGTLLFFSGQTTIWAFVERLGSAGGFPAQQVGTLLSVTLVFALSGSITSAVLGSRFGNTWPFVTGCAIFFCGLLLLNHAEEFAFYAAGACVVTYSFGMALPFAVSRVAALDSDGRYVVLSVPAIGIGAMLGPSIAGALATGGSYAPILAFGGTTVMAAVLLFLSVRQQHP